MGRWQILREKPLVVCDTGHNVNGISEVVSQLEQTPYDNLHIVFGMVGDKDVDSVLDLLPKTARYYFTQSSVRRAMSVDELKEKAAGKNLIGVAYDNVGEAVNAAMNKAKEEDVIYIGGSTFVVADALMGVGFSEEK